MNLALFDFDGTITDRDTFSSFLRFTARRHRIVLGALVLSPVVVCYRLGLIAAHQARPIASRFRFKGEPIDSIRQVGRLYAAEVLPGVVRRQALERIAWHQRQGDTVAVVSASLDAYLGPWCAGIGVDLICTELEERAGRLTGRYRHGDCSGPVKARRILARYDLSRYAVIYAYGDTNDDREMLELAHRKFYRWREIQDWSETVALGVEDPQRATPP
jgi:HAD superfamily hydrolase (TIGR01490 family)